MKFFGIDEVKDLEHDEGVEDEGEVSRDDHGLLINILVVPAAIDVFHSTTSDSTADNTVVPFVFGVFGENC